MSNIARFLEAAVSHYQRQQFPLAEQQLNEALRVDPSSIDAHLLLGIIQVQTRRFAEGERHLLQILKVNPTQWDALTWMGHCKRGEGNPNQALNFFERAIASEPANGDGYLNLGMFWRELGETQKAMSALKKAVELQPRSAQGWQGLGRMLAATGGVQDGYQAVEAFRRYIELMPQDPSGYVEIYRALDTLGEWAEARKYLAMGRERHPTVVPFTVLLAKACAKLGEAAQAEKLFQEALNLDPRAYAAYALWLQESGRFEESNARLMESIERLPTYGLAYYYLAEASAFDLSTGGTLLDRIAAVEETPDIEQPSRMYFAYAKARALEKAGDYEQSMANYDLANEIAHSIFNAGRVYDPQAMQDLLEQNRKVFSPGFFDGQAKNGLESRRPIFIVGMIRSGTTLLDQILSTHPDVCSAGEQPFWIQTGEAIVNEWSNRAPDTETILSIGSDYLDKLRQAVGDSVGDFRRITDKMPANYQYLGLIHTVFPHAKIVHVRRSPIDTCLSIYTTQFGGGVPFGHSKRNIVDHYRTYLDNMSYWRETIPSDVFFEIDYEELVRDKEAVVRRVLQLLELDWDDACLSHEGHKGTIMTPSRWQARQPVYTTSVERWRKFEPWLGELLELRSDK